MNEQIQKLIEECTSAYDDLVYDGTDSYMKTTEYFDIEKFAELIVKECAGVVANAVDYREPASTYVGKIKQHFGVEE